MPGKTGSELCISSPSAGMTRIRFVGLARTASQPGDSRTPHEIAAPYLIRSGFQGKSDLQVRLACEPPFCWIATNRRRAMTPFFVQIKCELGKAYQVANELAESEIASEIYSTAGDFDLLVKFYVEPGTDIGHFVNEKVQCITGIKDTRTIITFKAFQT
jgi:DNA-binding Lrp family transcriptional regulator